jgi:hypothetical protein
LDRARASFALATTLHATVALSVVIPRGCDFFDFLVWPTQPERFSKPHKAVRLSGCAFFDISCFWQTLNRNVFQPSHKTVILSEAPRKSIA